MTFFGKSKPLIYDFKVITIDDNRPRTKKTLVMLFDPKLSFMYHLICCFFLVYHFGNFIKEYEGFKR